LLFQIPEFSSYVWISGFNVRPADVEEILRTVQERLPKVCAQLVDLNKVAGSRYLFLATYNALKSFHARQSISRTLGMEILLYVAANRQISEALRRVGIGVETQKIAAIAVSHKREEAVAAGDLLEELFNVKSTDELLDSWPSERVESVKSGFGISSKELAATIRRNEDTSKAIERLAIERSALLTIRK
jgi:tRNA threonylcarbamoyladenosine modification (KEOPS) complex Cgi121 subunit